MATKSKNAPRGGVKLWREYLKWLEDKTSKPGQFRGNLSELKGSAEDDEAIGFKGSTKRGKESNKLNAAIAATPAFEGLKPGQAIKAMQARHPWATEQGISNPFFTQDALLTPHHLISCCVTKALTRHFTDVIENDIGYNVNCPHNLVMLPNSTAVACYLGVPPHEGGHEYGLSTSEIALTKKALSSKIGKEKVWGDFDEERSGYHAKVLKLVHQVIVKHFKCKKDLDHNKFIADMNKVSKKILKKLAKFQWLLHENGADYHRDSDQGCRNTRLVSSYIEGEGKEKAMGRESAKRVTKNFPKLQINPCSDREHVDDLQYFLHKINKNEMRGRGMRVATEVGWMTSKTSETSEASETSETSKTQDNKQTETA